jgi:hypothetical protein
MDATRQGETFEQARAGLPDVLRETSVYWKPLYRLIDDGTPVVPWPVEGWLTAGPRWGQV